MKRNARKFAYFCLSAWAVLIACGFVLTWMQRQETDPITIEGASLEQELFLLREELASAHARLKLAARYDKEAVGGFTPVPARVFPFPDLSPRRRSVALDIGAAAGVRVGHGVASVTGLVGKVAEVSENHCRVQLADDPRFRVWFAAIRKNTPLGEGIASGAETGALRSLFLRDAIELQPDDLLITAGDDGVFPRGLVIGRILDHVPPRGLRIQPPQDYLGIRNCVVLIPPHELPNESRGER